MTVAVALAQFLNSDESPWNYMMAIAIVYGAGTLVGGALAPALFGALIATKSPDRVFDGYLLGAIAMLVAALVELRFGVEAARRRLEDIAAPLSASAAAPLAG